VAEVSLTRRDTAAARLAGERRGRMRCMRHLEGRMYQEARSVAVLAALVALLLTGCAGGTSSNGLEDKSAAQIQ
jgi:hypothetical protein